MKYQMMKLAGALLFSAWAGTASAATLPECDGAGVLSRVTTKLSIAEANVVKSGDPVVSIDRIRHARTQEMSEPFFARRYCRATGYTDLGHKTTIYYLIEAKAGFAGYGYNVEACIQGRDPWRIYGAYCRSLR